MKIVFIAAFDNSHGRIILSELVKNGMPPLAVFVGSSNFRKQYRKKSMLRYLSQKGWFNFIWRLFHRLTNLQDVKSSTQKVSGNAVFSIQEICLLNRISLHSFDNINSIETMSAIDEFKPDIIVLGGAPLLKKELLYLPSIGVLNAHPGILPQARGMDVVAHSILNNIPLGISVFKVDEGTDTGPIILIEYLAEKNMGSTLQENEANVEALAGKAMVNAIKEIKNGVAKFVPQRKEEGNLFKAMGFTEYRSTKMKLSRRINPITQF